MDDDTQLIARQHAAWLAEQQTRTALEARIPQVKAIYPKLVAGTATNREVQGVLAFVLRWLQVQDSD